MSDWGWKATLYVYVKGERKEDDVSKLLDAFNRGLDPDVVQQRLHGEVAFVGARVDPVRDEPKDQGAT